MAIIFGVLEEEHERQKELKAQYETQLKGLPKGSLRIKQKGKRQYAYLVYRDGNRVHTSYVGLAGSTKVKLMRSQLETRKQAKEALRRVNADLRTLERVSRARRKK